MPGFGSHKIVAGDRSTWGWTGVRPFLFGDGVRSFVVVFFIFLFGDGVRIVRFDAVILAERGGLAT